MAQYVIDDTDAPIEFECNKDGNTVRTLQNCKNLIRCHMGEVPYDRMRGINPAIYDLPLTALNGVILSEVDRALEWEPDATAVRAWATMEKGRTVVHAIVDVRE